VPAVQPWLVFFYTPRSGESRDAEIALADAIAPEPNQGVFRIYRVDCGARPDLVERFRVTKPATFLVIEQNKVVARYEPSARSRSLRKFLVPWLPLRLSPSQRSGAAGSS
jgi:thioredoxin-like negative regulator of GroEL